jgi:hypothetical protein
VSDPPTHKKLSYMVDVAEYLFISKIWHFSLVFVHNTSNSKRQSLKEGSVPSVDYILQNLCSSRNGILNVLIRHHHHITKLLQYYYYYYYYYYYSYYHHHWYYSCNYRRLSPTPGSASHTGYVGTETPEVAHLRYLVYSLPDFVIVTDRLMFRLTTSFYLLY